MRSHAAAGTIARTHCNTTGAIYDAFRQRVNPVIRDMMCWRDRRRRATQGLHVSMLADPAPHPACKDCLEYSVGQRKEQAGVEQAQGRGAADECPLNNLGM